MPLYVSEFGAVGDYVTDNYEVLQVAINAACAQQTPLVFDAKPYGTSRKLVVPAQVELIGSCGATDATSIFAIEAMDCVIEFNSIPQIRQLTVDGRWKATSAVKFTNGSRGLVTSCKFMRGRLDGALVSVSSGGFYFNSFINSEFSLNGTTYATAGFPFQATNSKKVVVEGTVATEANGGMLVGTGTHFKTDFADLRQGDMIAVGTNPTEWLQLFAVVDDTHVTLLPNRKLPTLTRSGLGFCVGIGDGYHEETSTNIGNSHLSSCRGMHNAGCGAVFQGYWGAFLDGKYEGLANNFFAVCVGGAGAVANIAIDGLYFELNGAPAGVFASYANGLFVGNINGDKFLTLPDGKRTAVMVSNDSFNVGWEVNSQGNDGFSMQPIGAQFSSSIPGTVIKENAYARGKVFGDATPSGRPGNGYFHGKDSDGTKGRPAGWTFASGAQNDPNAVASRFGPLVKHVSPGSKMVVWQNGVDPKNPGPEVGSVDLAGNARFAGSLGVGNFVAEPESGSVVGKIEVFDTAGASLGFVSVRK